MGRKRSTKRKNEDNSALTISKGKCPVCFQIPRAHIFQCPNGHSICESCSTRVTACPTCRSPGVTIRNLLAESFLDDIKFKCSWSPRGCRKTMLRGQLTAHEDQCDQNPDVIKLCSTFFTGKQCEYKFTSNWLVKPENCIEFLNHVKTCLGFGFTDNIRRSSLSGRETFGLELECKEIVLNKLTLDASVAVHHTYQPVFYRSKLQNLAQVELFFILPLLKVDTLGNKIISFAYVQLTPETTPLLVKFRIDANPNARMASQWGGNCLSSLSWTQKTIGLGKFLEMVESPQNGPEPKIPHPFSLPLSLLKDYYLNADMKLVVKYTVEQTP